MSLPVESLGEATIPVCQGSRMFLEDPSSGGRRQPLLKRNDLVLLSPRGYDAAEIHEHVRICNHGLPLSGRRRSRRGLEAIKPHLSESGVRRPATLWAVDAVILYVAPYT